MLCAFFLIMKKATIHPDHLFMRNVFPSFGSVQYFFLLINFNPLIKHMLWIYSVYLRKFTGCIHRNVDAGETTWIFVKNECEEIDLYNIVWVNK
jgi:hypothetical protein